MNESRVNINPLQTVAREAAEASQQIMFNQANVYVFSDSCRAVMDKSMDKLRSKETLDYIERVIFKHISPRDTAILAELKAAREALGGVRSGIPTCQGHPCVVQDIPIAALSSLDETIKIMEDYR